MKLILFAPLILLLTEISFAKEKLNYTVTSDSQKNTLKGDLEAIGNVVVKRTKDNFEASSNKLTYDNDSKTLKLVGNVFIKNLESDEGLSIQESYGDELTIFTDTGLYEFKSKTSNRVKTKLKF
ncbi:LPS export ABC transporter periplasmic protein LptC [uncultured Prochlorococcus sp.]|uniref:LPS export ABC transporter periplasmic protein LptC n=1 Tax=uncultured Prochlorococcus sp. TaxID=159733 RepID=UPI0025837337|nr:LPS export ABC transporter periplasmic protein LptC [uncultured Prochlorococcus sp.]